MIYTGRGLKRAPYVQSVFTDTGRLAWTDTLGAEGFVHFSVAGSDEWFRVAAEARELLVAETGTEEYSKSLASPGNGLTSPKQRFARRTSAHKGVMSSIAMKFPHIKRSFMACKRVFEQHADRDTNTIPKSQVITVLIELGADPESFTKGSVEEIVQKANLDGDDVIDFKEFLIAAAVGCFLRADPSTTELSPCFLSIRKGFEAAKEAFGKSTKTGRGRLSSRN